MSWQGTTKVSQIAGVWRPRALAIAGAIEIARRQRAKSFELRATMSLARLLASEGRRDEARAMLADICGWLTEGFDTADLTDAKALLEDLQARPVLGEQAIGTRHTSDPLGDPVQAAACASESRRKRFHSRGVSSRTSRAGCVETRSMTSRR